MTFYPDSAQVSNFGRVVRKASYLYPSWETVDAYKSGDLPWGDFARVYVRDVLSKPGPHKAAMELSPNAILLCWEGPDKSCHRHIIASLRGAGVPCVELGSKDDPAVNPNAMVQQTTMSAWL
jgi:hypothetical protein